MISEQFLIVQTSWSEKIQRRVSECIDSLSQARLIKIMGIENVMVKYLRKLYRAEMDGLKKFRHTQSMHMLLRKFICNLG